MTASRNHWKVCGSSDGCNKLYKTLLLFIQAGIHNSYIMYLISCVSVKSFIFWYYLVLL